MKTSSGAQGPPQLLKKRSENAWANENSFIGVPINSGNRSGSCSENCGFRIAQVRETPLRERDFAFRELFSELRELQDHGKSGLSLRGVAFMTVLTVLAVLESTLPSICLSYEIEHNEATIAVLTVWAVLTVLAVSAVVAVSVMMATPLKLNPPVP